ncbi:MAG: GNAT family N-acetyltransferase [Alphaproteobacteria bacterium]|nr:GNAT family N-acetyltransferase [Alphaproteobacteria bacterium]MBV9904330.1 GNAT family N-acetyltransferase [Alphaproteobacteria bacterium]
MIEVVTSRNALLYKDALADMFHLRHRIFVEKMGWEALRKPARIEKDQFDTDDAIYLLLTEEDGTVIGTHRMLPTVKPHLFSDVFPNACAVRGVQRGEKILELTRTCVDEERLDKHATEKARKRLMVGLFEFCLRAGYEQVTIFTPTDLLFRYLLIGIDIKPLGMPLDIDGNKQVAVIVRTDEQALAAMRMALGVPEPQVHYVGAPEGDALHLAPAEPVHRVAAE